MHGDVSRFNSPKAKLNYPCSIPGEGAFRSLPAIVTHLNFFRGRKCLPQTARLPGMVLVPVYEAQLDFGFL